MRPRSIPFQTPSRLFRHKKHVVDPRSWWWCLRGGTDPPRQFTWGNTLLAQGRDDVREISVESSQTWDPLNYHYVGNESVYQRDWPSRACPPTQILEMEGGRVFGRTCFPIAPNGEALGEFAFNVNADKIAKSLRFGRWNPKYQRYRRRGDITARKRLPPVQRFEGTVAALNLYASHNFYHWMIDILPRLEALERAGVRPDKYLVDGYRPFQRQSLQALGISQDRIIQPHDHLLLEPSKLYTITRDNPDGRRRVGPWLARALHAHGGQASTEVAPKKVLIQRSRQCSRRIHNQDQLASELHRRGFVARELEQLTLEEQAHVFSEAEVIVALHGAGLSNTVFAPPHATIVELMPRGRVNFSYPLLSQSLGHQHWLVTVERVGKRQGVFAPISLVHEVLDQAQPHQGCTDGLRRAS